MNTIAKIVVVFCFLTIAPQGSAQSFTVIPFGVKGGNDEGNLSCYALAVQGTDRYVCLDAGTVRAGIQKCIELGTLRGNPNEIIRTNIKGYLISHAHLDHIEGLVINSTDDSPKAIYGLPFCLDIVKEKYFNWKNWANFANEGDKPTLNKYHYSVLSPGQETSLENTDMVVKAYPLSHGNPYQSTAFLVRHNDAYILYLGDTGADAIEKSDNLHHLWDIAGPLIKTKKLKAIFIEVSYPDEQPDDKLFGHLTPKLFMQEMRMLQQAAGDLRGFTVVVTHRKPIDDREEKIKQQLMRANAASLNLVFPEQGKPLQF